jgi:hypothetical protein
MTRKASRRGAWQYRLAIGEHRLRPSQPHGASVADRRCSRSCSLGCQLRPERSRVGVGAANLAPSVTSGWALTGRPGQYGKAQRGRGGRG